MGGVGRMTAERKQTRGIGVEQGGEDDGGVHDRECGEDDWERGGRR